MSQQRKNVTSSKKVDAHLSEKATGTGRRLLEYHEIPSWQQENEFILTGYRPTSGSVKVSLEALLYLNNETSKSFF